QAGQRSLERRGRLRGEPARARRLRPDEHPGAIGLMQPERLLELQMLAYQVVSERSSQFQVSAERIPVGRRQTAFGPVALVEHAARVDAFTVEEELLTPRLVPPHARGVHHA